MAMCSFTLRVDISSKSIDSQRPWLGLITRLVKPNNFLRVFNPQFEKQPLKKLSGEKNQ